MSKYPLEREKMSEKDPRIGVRRPDGSREFPALTISGKTYTMPPAAVTGLDAEHFVVLDVFAPRGFDVEAALDELRAALKPTPARRKGKTEDTIGSEDSR